MYSSSDISVTSPFDELCGRRPPNRLEGNHKSPSLGNMKLGMKPLDMQGSADIGSMRAACRRTAPACVEALDVPES
jgi:hypothetical protein